MTDPTRGLLPADGSDEDRLARLAAAAAPVLDVEQVDLLRASLGRALRDDVAARDVVALPAAPERHEVPGRAA